jgi:hypothetical protein
LNDIKLCYIHGDEPWKDICNWRLYGVRDGYFVSSGANAGQPCTVDNISADGTSCTLSYGVPSISSDFDSNDVSDRILYARQSASSNWITLNTQETNNAGTTKIQGFPRLIKYRINRTTLKPEGYDLTETPEDNSAPILTYNNIENFFNFQPQSQWNNSEDLAKSMYLCSLTDSAPTSIQSEQMYAMKLIEGTTPTPTAGPPGTISKPVTSVKCAIRA